MVDIFKVIGQRIYKRRKELKYSQENLAEITGLHRNSIGRIERAEKHVGIQTLEKIANALDLPLEKIFKGR